MNRLKIGWGRRDISTTEQVSLPGQMYMRISSGIHDPIFATALCLDGGEDVVVFLSVDMGVIRPGIQTEVRAKIKELNPDIPTDAVIMNATHTHACPSEMQTPETTPDGAYVYPGLKHREFYVRQCAEAVCEAWNRRADAGMAYGYGYAVVAHSRRTIYLEDQGVANPKAVAPNGFGVMYGNTKKDSFSHYESGADHFLNLMFTFDANDKLTGIVVNVPCPSQVSEHFTKISADYWHDVRELVKKEYGEDVYVLPQCAPAGDLSPRVLHYKEAQARRMELKYGLGYDPATAGFSNYNKCIAERYDIAERIMDGIRDVYGWAKKEILTQIPVRHRKLNVKLNRRMVTEEEKSWCENNIEALKNMIPDETTGTPEEIRKAVSNFNSVRNRNLRGIERFKIQNENPYLDTEIHVTQVGDIAFATNRFELYQDFMHRVQARSPFIQTFCVQLSGDEGGSYLPTQRGMNNKGYGSSIFDNAVGAEGGQQWVEYTLEALTELKNEDNA